jgi:tetratricopeptide (TPR) repeat protein
MAEMAIAQGSPGEAQRVLEKGFAGNLFADANSKQQAQKLLDQAKKVAATDLASLPKLEADVKASKTGDKDVGLALAYFSYEQYPKAVEAFSRGLQKGGVRNETEARLMLGISQLMAKDKDSAIKTLKSVTGDPKLARIANLWVLHAQQS